MKGGFAHFRVSHGLIIIFVLGCHEERFRGWQHLFFQWQFLGMTEIAQEHLMMIGIIAKPNCIGP